MLERTRVLVPAAEEQQDPYQTLISERNLSEMEKMNMELMRRENAVRRTVIESQFVSHNFHLFTERLDQNTFFNMKYGLDEPDLEQEYRDLKNRSSVQSLGEGRG